jgi:hypothetical protein
MRAERAQRHRQQSQQCRHSRCRCVRHIVSDKRG